MPSVTVNGTSREVVGNPDKPLLWVLREQLRLPGTRYGCGNASCGDCTVHLDGCAVLACALPLSGAIGRQVTTIEGLNQTALGRELHQAWAQLGVPQCGLCQNGQIMAAAALLARNRGPADPEIDAALSGNICRCGTGSRIRQAIRSIAGLAS